MQISEEDQKKIAEMRDAASAKCDESCYDEDGHYHAGREEALDEILQLCKSPYRYTIQL